MTSFRPVIGMVRLRPDLLVRKLRRWRGGIRCQPARNVNAPNIGFPRMRRIRGSFLAVDARPCHDSVSRSPDSAGNKRLPRTRWLTRAF